MAQVLDQINVYLETGKTRTFAVARDWPGWCRSGRNEESALQTLFDYAPRYASAIGETRLGFRPPSDVSALIVTERVTGDSTTDFGAPSITLASDSEPVNPDELERWQTILQACWRTFDEAVEAARGRALRKGPRGGGRELENIVEHVLGVDVAYLSSLGRKVKLSDDEAPDQAFARAREAIRTTLAEAARGELPERGPRGGARWMPRYFIRRLAWHELDHAWEIEDRAE